MITPARQVFDDVRALGTSTPVRAAYELSKRSGFHGVLFRPVRSAQPVRSELVLLGNITTWSETARERTLQDARLIESDGLRVFGARTSTGRRDPWNTDPQTGRAWPADRPWWQLDIRSDERLGDVKYVWEAGRHRDLVVLARAVQLEPTGPWAELLNTLLQSWCAQNPPEHGVHWYSSLEIALRAIAWSQVLALAGDVLTPTVREQLDAQLLAGTRHIMVELPYTLSSMRNNHLLGDALGLLIAARLFPSHGSAQRWQKVGDRLFAAQLPRHMRTDGSMIEDSLSYHRFVLEMLAVRVLLGDAPTAVRVALRAASEHLQTLGVFAGELPQYGDWDEGRVLASSGDALDVAGSAALGLALTGAALPASWQDDYDELAWYADQPVPDPAAAVDEPALAEPPRATAVSGGIAYVRRGPWKVWYKVGAGSSHGHADLTSVWVQRNDNWLIADPGTGTYNGPLEVRNGLRTSLAHPVVRLDGEDQLQPHRAFRWMHSARGRLAPPVTVGGVTVLFGWHDAYARLAPGLTVARCVLVDDTSVVVIDLLPPAAAGRPAAITLPLGPAVAVAGGALICNDELVDLFGPDGFDQHRGEQEPFLGWHSTTYGQWAASSWLTWQLTGQTSIWGLGESPDPVAAHGDHAIVGALELRPKWTEAGVELEITHRENRDGVDPLTVVRA